MSYKLFFLFMTLSFSEECFKLNKTLNFYKNNNNSFQLVCTNGCIYQNYINHIECTYYDNNYKCQILQPINIFLNHTLLVCNNCTTHNINYYNVCELHYSLIHKKNKYSLTRVFISLTILIFLITFVIYVISYYFFSLSTT